MACPLQRTRVTTTAATLEAPLLTHTILATTPRSTKITLIVIEWIQEWILVWTRGIWTLGGILGTTLGWRSIGLAWEVRAILGWTRSGTLGTTQDGTRAWGWILAIHARERTPGEPTPVCADHHEEAGTTANSSKPWVQTPNSTAEINANSTNTTSAGRTTNEDDTRIPTDEVCHPRT